MEHEKTSAVGPSEIDGISLVVDDLDAALVSFERILGVAFDGPYTVHGRSGSPEREVPIEVRIAISRARAPYVELVERTEGGLYGTDVLGFNHVHYAVDDVEDAARRASEAGLVREAWNLHADGRIYSVFFRPDSFAGIRVKLGPPIPAELGVADESEAER